MHMLLLRLAAAASAALAPALAFQVGGYLPDYRSSEALTMVASQVSNTSGLVEPYVYLFSAEVRDSSGLDTGRITPEMLEAVSVLKASAPHTKVLLAVGGGGRSDRFRKVAAEGDFYSFVSSIAAYVTAPPPPLLLPPFSRCGCYSRPRRSAR